MGGRVTTLEVNEEQYRKVQCWYNCYFKHGFWQEPEKKAFLFFPPGRIGLQPPWLAITLKYCVPTQSLHLKKMAVLCRKSPWLPLGREGRQKWLQREGFSLEFRAWSFKSLLGICLCSCSQSTSEGTTTEQKTIAQFHSSSASSAPGPSCTLRCCEVWVGSFQLQTPEPQGTGQEFCVCGMPSTFLYPAPAGVWAFS